MSVQPPWIPEYHALTCGVGLADLTGRSRVLVRGGDRVRFLHSFCTNDIQRLSPGQGCEAFVTNHQGKTVGHIFVTCQTDALVLDAVPGIAEQLISHLDRFVISDDVTFQDLTPSEGELLLAGPHAAELLAQASGRAAPTQAWDHGPMMIGGEEVNVCCADFLLPASYFLAAPRISLDAIRSTLMGAGAVVCGSDAVEAVRLESGAPLFGREITEDNLPQEIRRDQQTISFTKGCYLGQETIARIDAMGHVNRWLVGMRFPACSTVPAPGSELRVGDKVIGHVTSAAWSPRLGEPLAMAMVRRAQATIGTKLESPAGTGEVVMLPLA